MPALARGQENTTGIINWFLTVNGVLTDAAVVEFRIFDITGGLPGTQVFPATVGDWEDVSNAPGHFSVGSYYAYDNANAQGWTPPLTQPIGTHRIEWRWKITAGAPYQSGAEDFEVLVQSAGSSADLYAAVSDVRAVGLDASIADDDTVLAALEIWQAFLERATRQWFVPKSIVLKVDGTDSDTIHFGVPIISIDYVRLNDDPNNLDTALYRVYNAVRYPDDRRNPRIKLVNERELDIYTAPIVGRQQRFRKGRQNQEIKGTFGYVEDDGSVPKLIKRALVKLVVEKLTHPIYTAGGSPTAAPPSPPPILGEVLEEWTDGHKLKYGTVGSETTPRAIGLVGMTNDQEIHDIIKLYKAPLGIATPAHPSYM
jgi:hypothetical protein